MRTLALMLLALALPMTASADNCADCKSAATAANQACEAASKAPAAAAECKKKAEERSAACDAFACKVAAKTAMAPAANACLDCRVKVSGDSKVCDEAAKTPEAKATCMKTFQTANAACACPAEAAPKK